MRRKLLLLAASCWSFVKGLSSLVSAAAAAIATNCALWFKKNCPWEGKKERKKERKKKENVCLCKNEIHSASYILYHSVFHWVSPYPGINLQG